MPQHGAKSAACKTGCAVCCGISISLASLATLAGLTPEIKYDFFELPPLLREPGDGSDGAENPSLVATVMQWLPQPGTENQPELESSPELYRGPDLFLGREEEPPQAPVINTAPIIKAAPVVEAAPVAKEPLPTVNAPVIKTVPIIKAAPVVEAAPIVEAEFPGFNLECRSCGECEGDVQSLVGGGNSQDACFSACAAERSCRYVAYDVSLGYCHWFSSSACTERKVKKIWIRLRKVSQANEEMDAPRTRDDHTDTEIAAAVPAGGDTKWDLFVVIPAGAGERERRDAIRATWVKMITSKRCKRCLKSKVTYRFVVGAEVDAKASRREAAEFGDLAVLEDFAQEKGYASKRSEKTFRSIRYAVQHFDFRFLLKCDTDSWVYLDRLLNYFDAHDIWQKDRLYAGNFNSGAGAQAKDRPSEKWYDPVYPKITGFREYPKHAKGAGYVLARSVAEDIALQPLDFWEYLPSEDIAVGFWLMAIHKDMKNIPVEVQANCGAESTVVDHYITPEIMRARWQTYEKTSAPCMIRSKR